MTPEIPQPHSTPTPQSLPPQPNQPLTTTASGPKSWLPWGIGAAGLIAVGAMAGVVGYRLLDQQPITTASPQPEVTMESVQPIAQVEPAAAASEVAAPATQFLGIEEYEQYTSPGVGISFLYPKGWIKKENNTYSDGGLESFYWEAPEIPQQAENENSPIPAYYQTLVVGGYRVSNRFSGITIKKTEIEALLKDSEKRQQLLTLFFPILAGRRTGEITVAENRLNEKSPHFWIELYNTVDPASNETLRITAGMYFVQSSSDIDSITAINGFAYGAHHDAYNPLLIKTVRESIKIK